VGWLAPVLFCASLALLGWSFYNLYVRGMGSRVTTIITWTSLVLIIGFWSWHLMAGGVWATSSE
jgi:hypothetical protein